MTHDSIKAAIQFEGVTKMFGEVTALDGLDLTVAPNQVYGLIGPDGAGKTTAIRILATLMLPTGGKARILGYDITKRPQDIKRRIGYMPQSFSLYRDLTVAENVAFYAGIYRVPRSEMSDRLKKLIDFTGLGPFTGRLAEALSGGMRQKLMLACTLIHEPELVLLDEPTTGVDPIARRQFWQILEELVTRGMTVFVSTPYMDEAERCHRVAFMDAGRLVREGTVDQLKMSQAWRLFEVRGPQIRNLVTRMQQQPGIITAQLFGNTLRVQLDKDHDRETIGKCLPGDAQYQVEEISPTLEDVFAKEMMSDE